MSQENVEILRRTIEAFNRRSWDEALLSFDANAEWYPLETDPEQRAYRGHAEIRRFWQSWVETFDRFQLEVAEFIDAGEHVIAMTRLSGQGRHSGVDAGALTRPFPQVAQLREGKIVRLTMYPSKEAAMETLGLSAQDAHADSS